MIAKITIRLLLEDLLSSVNRVVVETSLKLSFNKDDVTVIAENPHKLRNFPNAFSP